MEGGEEDMVTTERSIKGGGLVIFSTSKRVKPTETTGSQVIENATLLYETDTELEYRYDASKAKWYEQPKRIYLTDKFSHITNVLWGLSKDKKPKENYGTLTLDDTWEFREIDTGDVYRYDKLRKKWYLQTPIFEYVEPELVPVADETVQANQETTNQEPVTEVES